MGKSDLELTYNLETCAILSPHLPFHHHFEAVGREGVAVLLGGVAVALFMRVRIVLIMILSNFRKTFKDLTWAMYDADKYGVRYVKSFLNT